MGRGRTYPALGDLMAFDGQEYKPQSLATVAGETGSDAFIDANFSIIGSVDPTKAIRFEADSQSSGFTTTIDIGAQNASRTATIPALAGAANFVMREAALTDNAVTRADGTTGKIQDSLLVVGDTGNVSGVVDLALTGNVTQTGATTLSTGTGTQTINGNMVVTTGKTITAVSGIIFSNETLSQYDEGTWTPTILGSVTPGTPTYYLQSGRYTRIGRMVNCTAYVGITAKTGIAGNVQLGGLPFTIGGSFVCSVIGAYEGITMSAGHTQLGAASASAVTVIQLSENGSAAVSNPVPDANLAAASFFLFTCIFEV